MCSVNQLISQKKRHNLRYRIIEETKIIEQEVGTNKCRINNHAV